MCTVQLQYSTVQYMVRTLRHLEKGVQYSPLNTDLSKFIPFSYNTDSLKHSTAPLAHNTAISGIQGEFLRKQRNKSLQSFVCTTLLIGQAIYCSSKGIRMHSQATQVRVA